MWMVFILNTCNYQKVEYLDLYLVYSLDFLTVLIPGCFKATWHTIDI
jgi:hypothetical protein